MRSATEMSRRFTVLVLLLANFTARAGEKKADAPIPPREAAVRMTVPDGFKVTLFAGEPDVVQPIAFTFDDRGRLWVAECRSYPKWSKDAATRKVGDMYLDHRQWTDRVLIFEDADGDGQFDKRTVFADKLTNLTGINYGFGGIWLCSIPNLLFIPDKDGDDRPDGPPEIKLDGWSLNSGHNAFNGIKWGPDGWLYGCNGITATSLVGVPGTPEKERTPINCGVWRYHPTKKKFEVVAHGTTNPWGLDWDEYGELFITNCVIDHVWHIVPGGHYERMYGNDFNPHLYKLMPSIADHKHWGGGHWTTSRGGQGAHSVAGGGHAHAGCMIYLGDNWPKAYRGGLFTCNLHGNRVNHDLLERKGSSYVARHGKDFLFANDPWFRGLGIDYGPDGGVYVSDWTDTGECHNYQVAHTGTGRIYKVVYGTPKGWRGDLAKLSDKELVELHGHANEWFVRHARRILQERARGQGVDPDAAAQLIASAFDGPASARLRSMFTAYVIRKLDMQAIERHVNQGDESRRAWAFRLAMERRRDTHGDVSGPRFEMWMAGHVSKEPSALVRLHVAGEMQRLPLQSYSERGFARQLARSLSNRGDQAADPWLPLMLWYGVERLIGADFHAGFDVLFTARVPLVRQNVVRRMAGHNEPIRNSLPPELRTADLAADKGSSVLWLLEKVDNVHNSALLSDVLAGILSALQGQRDYPMPSNWNRVYAHLRRSDSKQVHEQALRLAVIFGDKTALTALEQLVRETKASSEERSRALQTLLDKRLPNLAATLHSLLDDEAMRRLAIQGLAAYSDSKTPSRLMERYAKLTADEKTDAIATLSARPEYALALLDAVEKKIVPRQDLNAFMVRQLLALNHPKVTERVNQVWGTLRSPSADKAARLAGLKKQLEPEALKQANLGQGRALFTKHCAACHKLFGEGGAIGPDLTGSQRINLDYVLENMLDPSALVPREYQVQIVLTEGGRTITGIVKEETDRALTMQTQNEVIVVPKDEIDSRRQSNVSMMPEGVIEQLRPEELRDLVAYLASNP
jgi:putative membrane-bound dehydrogenase-like protein